MIFEALSAVRDLGRLHTIATILIRFGFGDLVRRLGIVNVLEKAGQALNWQYPQSLRAAELPERVRRAMEEMGPTFIKLGQILATRVDLFPPEWIHEFEKLHDRVPPVPFEKLQGQLEDDLQAAIADVFTDFDQTPLAAASIAQVHRAKLKDGAEVIVKIRRPGIERIVEADLRLLERFARLAENEISELRRYRPRDVVRQFAQTLRRELDLGVECRNAERMAHCFVDDAKIVVPKVYWEWVGERVNVQQFVDGIRAGELEQVDSAGYDRNALARRGADAVLKMVLMEGFFHADPHPGNIIYLPGECIAFIDFGMVGRLSETRRYQVVKLLHAIVESDSNQVVDVLIDWTADTAIDTEFLSTEIDTFIHTYHGVPLKRLDMSAMLTDLVGLIRDHRLTLPPDLVLLIKTLITLEGMGRQLDPEFNMVTAATPMVQNVMTARYDPENLAKRGRRNVAELAEIVTGMPRDLRRLLRIARTGAIKINVNLGQLETFGRQVDNAASRLTIGMITAALIIASSIVMTVPGGPTLFGLPAFGLFGFLAAAIGGIWLLVSIWRGTGPRS